MSDGRRRDDRNRHDRLASSVLAFVGEFPAAGVALGPALEEAGWDRFERAAPPTRIESNHADGAPGSTPTPGASAAEA